MDAMIPHEGTGMELFIFIAPVVMGLGLWLILRYQPDKQRDDDASTRG